MGTANGPKITDWFTIGIAFLALLASSWAAWSTHRTNVRQGRQLRENQEHDVRRQAAQVAAWGVPTAEESGITSIRIYRINASHLPIFDLKMSLDGYGGWQSEMPAFLPTTEVERPCSSVVPDWTDVRWEVQVVVMTFTDAEGNRWRRDKAGLTLLDRARTAERSP